MRLALRRVEDALDLHALETGLPRQDRRAQALMRRMALTALRPRAVAATRPTNVLGRVGSLEIRLATSRADIRQAQRLRYSVFHQEMSARAGPLAAIVRRDADSFDAVCDHLLVLDGGAKSPSPWRRPDVVGTYRLLRQEMALRHAGFYSAAEYRIADLLGRHPRSTFLELGRSCVLPNYRGKRTIELLWHGIWTYVLRHKVDVLIGCASFAGTDPDQHALALSFLHNYASAPEEWLVSAHANRYVEMNRIPKSRIDVREAMRHLPPLLKGYLRLGASVGRGAVIDRQFGTTDVLVVLPVSRIDPRYIEHFGADASRHAAG